LAREFREVVESCGESCIEMVAGRDPEILRRSRETGRPLFPWVINFKRLLSETAFVKDIQALLQILERAYDYPVDVEFTTNFLSDGSYRINLVQCRPFQVRSAGPVVAQPESVAPADLVMRTQGAVIGPCTAAKVGRIIYVVPSEYGAMPLNERYSIARLIGRLTRLDEQPQGALLLLGPGRWGTAEPSLGVPVSFAEISRASVLCEVIEMREGLEPDVSLGTHFFNDLVESQILYLALVPGKEGNCLNRELLEHAPNQLAELIPDEAKWSGVVRVIDPEAIPGRDLRLTADALRQSAICFFGPS
jgi:hypothetical protein